MQGQVYNEETQRRQQASDLVAQQITEGKRRLEMADRNQRFNAMMGDFLKRPQFAGTVAGAPVMRPPQMDPSQMLRMAAESGAATPDMVSDSLRMQAADRRQRLLDSGEMLQEHEVGGRKFVVNRFTGQMVPLDAPADLDKRANPTGSAKLSTLRQLRADAVRELSTPGLMRDPKARAATQKRIDEIDDQIAVLLSGPGAATGGPGDVDRDPLGLFK
jgi:hypothetical protein